MFLLQTHLSLGRTPHPILFVGSMTAHILSLFTLELVVQDSPFWALLSADMPGLVLILFWRLSSRFCLGSGSRADFGRGRSDLHYSAGCLVAKDSRGQITPMRSSSSHHALRVWPWSAWIQVTRRMIGGRVLQGSSISPANIRATRRENPHRCWQPCRLA